MRSRTMIAAIAGAVLMFGVLGYLSWKTKYGRGQTVSAVVAIDTIVLHQRVIGQGLRGPVAQDRLVAIDGRTGDEYARTTVLRGQLVGVLDDKAIYAIDQRLVLYDPRTLEASPAPRGTIAPRPTQYGALVDLGDSLLMLDASPVNDRARASRLHREDRTIQWSQDLPWRGHDTKLVVQLGGHVVIVDADGTAAVDRNRGDMAWVRR